MVGISVFWRLFQRAPPIRDTLDNCVRRLEIQQRRIESFVDQLRRRDQALFNACAEALVKNDKKRARMYADELVELRRLGKTIQESELVLERLVIRLGTIRALGDIFMHLRPALNVVKRVSKDLSEIIPDIASELGKVGDTLSDELLQFSISVPQLAASFEAKEPEEIVNEASAIVEQRLKSKLPELTPLVADTRVVSKGQNSQNLLLATADEEEQDTTTPAAEPMPAAPPEIETRLLTYLKVHPGPLTVDMCAKELAVSPKEIYSALDSLSSTGKIKM